MKCFVILTLLGSSLAAPQLLVKPYINSGSAAGPLTAAFGDLVQTPKGLRSLALEGFSEDLNQDGFVDPIGQAVVPVVQHVAPVVHTYALPAVKTVAAPALTYTHTLPYRLGWPWGLPVLPAAPKAAEGEAVVEAARKKREADAEADPALLYGGLYGGYPGYGYGYGYPYAHHALAGVKVEVPEVKTVEVAAPALTYTHHVPAIAHVPAVAHVPTVAYQQYAVAHPFTTVQKHVTTHTTHHVINHAPVIGAVGAVAAPAAEAAVEEA